MQQKRLERKKITIIGVRQRLKDIPQPRAPPAPPPTAHGEA